MKALLFATIVVGTALGDVPTAEPTTLTAAELQQLLGVKAWRVVLPKEFGKYYSLRFEHYEAGKRTLTLGGGGEVPQGRTLVVTLNESDQKLTVTALEPEFTHPITISKDDLGGTQGPGYFAKVPVKVRHEDGRLILYEASHYKAKLMPDGKSYSTLHPGNKLVARSVILIEKYQTSEQTTEAD